MTDPQLPVTVAHLRNHLQETTIVEAEGQSAIRVAGGWLRSRTGLDPWPDPLPEDLWAWWVELAGLVYDNPRLVSLATVGTQTVSWAPAASARRRQILDEAAEAYPKAAAGAQFQFPPARPWPTG